MEDTRCLRFLYYGQAWTNCAPDADRARSSVQNLWNELDLSGAQILPCKKEKIIRSRTVE